ncbi:MAG: T9SS type A sorting domain-containing protein [Microscillaceae bacterium]|nr:T9SS type A sorting domain-containing protein [Microscillaceae bacterium]
MKKAILVYILFILLSESALAQCPGNCNGSNTFWGFSAGLNNTTGTVNTFIGGEAGKVNADGGGNTFVGGFAGASNVNGFENTFIGAGAGAFNKSGVENTYIGNQSGYNNINGVNNTFVGQLAGFNNTVGHENTFIGRSAGGGNTTGQYNTFVGSYAGGGLNGFYNTALGYEAGRDNVNGLRNTFLGSFAGRLNRGNLNTILGQEAGKLNVFGFGNVFLGNQAGYNETSSNKLYIANDSTSNPLIYGDFSQKVVALNGALGIGIKNPERPIHLRATNAIFRIDRDRPDPGFAIVRYDAGFNNVWKSFYFYTFATGVNQGKFVIADWGTNVAGPSTHRLVIENNGNIGLGVFNPTAHLHNVGTVRFENLPQGQGRNLVIDNNGNVFVSSNANKNAPDEVNQQLLEQIESLKERLETLENQLAKIQGLESETIDKNTAQLHQNQPNPFGQSTVISYYLPEKNIQAMILITDLQGKEISRLPINQKGEGGVTVQAGSLHKGLYLYTLVVDGKIVDSKRMLITD